MNEIRLRGMLSYLYSVLSEKEAVCRDKFVQSVRRNGAELLEYLKYQALFLIRFKYTKENIQAHLIHKAAAFFGFEIEKEQLRKKRKNKPVRKYLRLKSKMKTKQKQSESKLSGGQSQKNDKKNKKNIYRPPG